MWFSCDFRRSCPIRFGSSFAVTMCRWWNWCIMLTTNWPQLYCYRAPTTCTSYASNYITAFSKNSCMRCDNWWARFEPFDVSLQGIAIAGEPNLFLVFIGTFDIKDDVSAIPGIIYLRWITSANDLFTCTSDVVMEHGSNTDGIHSILTLILSNLMLFTWC